MIFYDQKALKLFLDARAWINQNDDKRGDILAKMTKLMSECKAIAIECASKLAPYQSPKLESIEVNKKVTHRYVIQAPQQLRDADQWLKSINKGAADEHLRSLEPMKIIENRKTINQTNDEIMVHPRMSTN